jgi:4-hydroxy-2-oxoheptanedioate aldolase
MRKVSNPLLEGWWAGRPAVGVWCSSRDSLVAETLASAGPDYVCIDLQHGASEFANLVEMLQAVQAGGSTAVVRVPENSLALINKALDAGASGIIIPLVDDAEGTRRAVEACRFPPRGQRSFGPFRASLSGRIKEPADAEDVACIPMIETARGLAQVEEIAAVDGVSAIYVGPSDLSIALGLPPGSVDEPTFVEALARIRRAAVDGGVVAGIHTQDGDRAAQYLAQGFGMVTAAADLRSLRAAMCDHLDRARRGATEHPGDRTRPQRGTAV